MNQQQQTEHRPPWMDYHPGDTFPTEILTLERVLERTGMSRSGWYQLISQGRAPVPSRRGVCTSVWDSREIEAWNRWQMDTLPRRVG
jgi:predicted DNA-binding transcriptional regulator AlpA